jgi:hypothetical protein
MTNGDGSPVGAEKRAEFFRDFIQTVLQLGAGSVVFSVTFLHEILRVGENSAGHLPTVVRHPGAILAGWLSLLGSVIASVVYLYLHAVSTKYENSYGEGMNITAGAAVLGLVAGLILLVVFAYKNLPV